MEKVIRTAKVTVKNDRYKEKKFSLIFVEEK